MTWKQRQLFVMGTRQISFGWGMVIKIFDILYVVNLNLVLIKQLSSPRLILLYSLRPIQMATIFQTIFPIAFSWMKMYKFRLRFQWFFLPRVQSIIFQRNGLAHQGDKPLSEPTMVRLLTRICVTHPQWANVHVTLSFEMNFAEWMLICGFGRRRKSVSAVPYYPSACWEKLLVTELAFQFNDTRLNFRCHDMIFSDSQPSVGIDITMTS